jgi:hypothetical protein
LQADLAYRYDSGEQGLVERQGGSLTADHIKVLRLLSTRSLKVLAQVGGLGAVLPECL